MPPKETPESLLNKHLGKEAGKAILGRIDQLNAEGVAPAQIQKETTELVAAHIEHAVMSAVLVDLGPVPVIKIRPIQVGVNSAVKTNVSSSIKIQPSISVKIEPGMIVSGPR